MHGHQDMVQVLLGQGAELNAKDKGGWLPLHYAAKSGYLNTVKLLVDNGMIICVSIINQAFDAGFRYARFTDNSSNLRRLYTAMVSSFLV